jgi:acyl-ACP thioesterase
VFVYKKNIFYIFSIEKESGLQYDIFVIYVKKGFFMQKYTKDICVDIHDVDFNGVAKASSLMKYVQLAAQAQLTDNGMSYDELKSRNRAFILSRIKLEFTEPVRAFEALTAITFPCESRGYSFLRCYKLKKGDKTIARAVSLWALIDTDTRSLVKVNDFELGLETFAPLDLTLGRFIIPACLSEAGRYTVHYGEVDQNRHMNNTRYPDMYASFLPMENMRISEITINYQNEAPEGEELTVLMGKDEEHYYFRTVRQDGKINTEAEIKLVQI